jgi:DNA-binding response OmpR family regulator
MPSMEPKSVWVVESEPTIASTLAIILESQGYRAKVFARPSDALQACSMELPAVVVADVSLPDLAGIDLAASLKQACPECGVLLLSAQANTSETIVQAARSLGPRSTLMPKPLHPKVLLETLNELSASDVPRLLD